MVLIMILLVYCISNLLKLPSMPKMSAWERGFPGRNDSLALCLRTNTHSRINHRSLINLFTLYCSDLPGLFHQPAFAIHHLCSPLLWKDNLDSRFWKSIPCFVLTTSGQFNVGYPQYPQQVLPLHRTHLEAPPFLPRPRGYCSHPCQDCIKTSMYKSMTSLCGILLRNISIYVR